MKEWIELIHQNSVGTGIVGSKREDEGIDKWMND